MSKKSKKIINSSKVETISSEVKKTKINKKKISTKKKEKIIQKIHKENFKNIFSHSIESEINNAISCEKLIFQNSKISFNFKNIFYYDPTLIWEHQNHKYNTNIRYKFFKELEIKNHNKLWNTEKGYINNKLEIFLKSLNKKYKLKNLKINEYLNPKKEIVLKKYEYDSKIDLFEHKDINLFYDLHKFNSPAINVFSEIKRIPCVNFKKCVFVDDDIFNHGFLNPIIDKKTIKIKKNNVEQKKSFTDDSLEKDSRKIFFLNKFKKNFFSTKNILISQKRKIQPFKNKEFFFNNYPSLLKVNKKFISNQRKNYHIFYRFWTLKNINKRISFHRNFLAFPKISLDFGNLSFHTFNVKKPKIFNLNTFKHLSYTSIFSFQRKFFQSFLEKDFWLQSNKIIKFLHSSYNEWQQNFLTNNEYKNKGLKTIKNEINSLNILFNEQKFLVFPLNKGPVNWLIQSEIKKILKNFYSHNIPAAKNIYFNQKDLIIPSLLPVVEYNDETYFNNLKKITNLLKKNLFFYKKIKNKENNNLNFDINMPYLSLYKEIFAKTKKINLLSWISKSYINKSSAFDLCGTQEKFEKLVLWENEMYDLW